MTGISLRTQPQSGAEPDLTKLHWPWTYFVSSHWALCPLHTWVLLILYIESIHISTVNYPELHSPGKGAFQPRTSLGHRGSAGMAAPADSSPWHAGSARVPMHNWLYCCLQEYMTTLIVLGGVFLIISYCFKVAHPVGASWNSVPVGERFGEDSYGHQLHYCSWLNSQVNTT